MHIYVYAQEQESNYHESYSSNQPKRRSWQRYNGHGAGLHFKNKRVLFVDLNAQGNPRYT